MKKLLLLLSILSIAILILLATIDLAPYLSEQPETSQITATQLPDHKKKRDTTEISPATPPTTLVEKIVTQPELMTEPLQKEESILSPPEITVTSEQAHQTTPLVASSKTSPGPDSDSVPDEIIQLKAVSQLSSTPEAETPAPPSTPSITKNKTTEALLSLVENKIVQLPEEAYPLSILLETYDEKATAQQSISLYQDRGIETYWVKVDLGKRGVKYRLFTGFFSTTEKAKRYQQKLKLKHKPIKRTYHSALIGIFENKEVLASAYSKTVQADVVPYILGTESGRYYLYVGAFYTHAGAEAQCSDLVAQKLSCKPAKRTTQVL